MAVRRRKLPRTFCEVYGGKKKRRHATEYEAQDALERMQEMRTEEQKSPEGWYWHDKCGGFHLTSETPEEYRENKRKYGLVGA